LRLIDQATEGFLYIVSTDSTTGSTKSILYAADYFNRIKNARLKNPFMIGFNIHDRESFIFANQYADGAIIGSALIKAIAESKNLEEDILHFVHEIKEN
jgi:tryptophan synthase alpha chain